MTTFTLFCANITVLSLLAILLDSGLLSLVSGPDLNPREGRILGTPPAGGVSNLRKVEIPGRLQTIVAQSVNNGQS